VPFSPGGRRWPEGPDEGVPISDMTGRAWQRMLSGRRLDLLDPSPLDVEIEDIAHGLSRVARWNGQTARPWPFSVAQHCLLVEDLAGRLKEGFETPWRRAALLHDAPEYVIGDMISPFKAALGIDYAAFESRLEAAIHLRFSLPAKLPPAVKRLIKRADRAAAHLEATQLAGFTAGEANRFFGRLRADLAHALEPLSPDQAKQAFIERFQELAGDP